MMTVREIITTLLDCDMDAEVVLVDECEFEDENGKVKGHVFHIQGIEKRKIPEMVFDNWEFRRRCENNTESEEK